MDTATQHVAEFVAEFDLASAPGHVVEKAKVTLLHDLGVAVAGHRVAGPAFTLAKDFGRCAPGSGARLLVDGTTVTVEHATVANAALMHARTQDDTQLVSVTHLGCTTLPALLAVADRERASGREVLAAMIAGYEAASAIAEAHGLVATSRGFRATSIFGPFAAAAATSRLLGLKPAETASALGLAAAFGGGTSQTWLAGTQEWQYQVGVAGRNGLLASLLAQRGVTAAPDALEGAAGFYRCFGDEVGSIGAQLGSRWRILDVTYKPYPTCALNQAPVWVMAEVAAEHDLSEHNIRAVILALHPAEAAYPGMDSRGPFEDAGGRLMSAPYCLAVAIRNHDVGLADIHSPSDDGLMDLVRRIEVVGDPGLSSGSCRITVRTSDGELTREQAPMFAWDRAETLERLRGIAADMPFAPERFADIILDLEHRQADELITAVTTP